MAIQLKFDLTGRMRRLQQPMGISVDSVRRYIHRGAERIRRRSIRRRRTMNENRLNFPEIQDAPGSDDPPAFAQEAGAVGTGMDGAERDARDAAGKERAERL